MIGCTKPRIELDKTAWGDQAYITSAVIFKYDIVKDQLGYNDPIEGYQEIALTTVSNVIDRPNANIKIVATKGTDLTKIGIRFAHTSEKIEPINGAPAAGVISNFSSGKFTYKVTSADGTVRNWNLDISVQP